MTCPSFFLKKHCDLCRPPVENILSLIRDQSELERSISQPVLPSAVNWVQFLSVYWKYNLFSYRSTRPGVKFGSLIVPRQQARVWYHPNVYHPYTTASYRHKFNMDLKRLFYFNLFML